MKRVIEALIIGIIASLIAGIILAPYLIPIFWQTYKTEIYISAIFVLVLCVLYLILDRIISIKKRLSGAFEVSKPVKKLTPDDFHITNYIEFYINRESDKDIEDLLSKGEYIFITGIPMLGKTRMAYEATKKLTDFYLLKPKYEMIDIEKLKLPLFKRKIVLFLDDIDKYVGKFNIDALIRKIKEKATDIIVITTCRSGKEFEQVFAEKEMENLLTQCQKNKIEPRLLEMDEEKRLATEVGKDLNQIASDRTPGSITIDLRYMKERYNQLKEEKSILKCMKLLRSGNIFVWKEEFLKQISKEIFNLDTNRSKWDDYIESLLSAGFIKRSSDQINISHDAYLDDRFLDDYIVSDNDLIQLKNILFKLKDTENLFYLGNGFITIKNMSEAEDCFRKSIDIIPYYAEVHYNLGTLLSKAKRYEEAEKEFKEALWINPDFAEVHYNLGTLLSEVKRNEEAEKEYEETLRINPDYLDAHNNLGILFKKHKRYREAEKEYRETLRIEPDYAEGHGNLGILLSELNRHEEARKEFEIALNLFRKQGKVDDMKKTEKFLKDINS